MSKRHRILLAILASAFLSALTISSTARACGDGSGDVVVLVNGELPGGG